MFRRFGGCIVALRLLLLSCLAVSGAFTQITIDRSGIQVDGRALEIRGVVYGNAPIGESGGSVLSASGCLYARDFPLIRAIGANTIRTRERVDPEDVVFTQALDENELYWLAGFPLSPYFDSTASLSPEAAGGRELRDRILGDFLEYVQAWAFESRLLGFVFGNEVARNYETKFAGSPDDFDSLLAEAGALLEEAGLGSFGLTTSVASLEEVDDANQPHLDFWSVDFSGRADILATAEAIGARTAKPYLVSGFGIDAYDGESASENALLQATIAETLALGLEGLRREGVDRFLGGVYDGFVDEWHRGGDPAIHGIGFRTEADSPDGSLHLGWTGLFGAIRTGVAGLDALRPRLAYAALASAWGGQPPDELTMTDAPRVNPDGVQNTASGFPFVPRGGLMSVFGEQLSAEARETAAAGSLPLSLGSVSVCVEGRPAPLFYADENEIRAQAPWEAPASPAPLLVYRAGVASAPSVADVREAAPGIFERGVFQPGLPCPVNEENGVRPGSFLEVYGTGLGEAMVSVPTGSSLAQPVATQVRPKARLDSGALEVVYSGFFPNVVGVTQTNVRIPDDQPLGLANLHLELGGVFSNGKAVQILSEQDRPGFSIADPEPADIVIQEGGPPQTAFVEINGFNGFCSLVRFELAGLPFGVKATIPVGFPGQRVPLRLQAEAGAPRLDQQTVTLRAVSVSNDRPASEFRLTVLPGSGDITFQVVSGGWLSGAPQASFRIESQLVFETQGGGPGRGFNFLTVDPQTGTIGSVHSFDTWASEEDVAAMEQFLLGLPSGILVLGAIADDGFLLITDQTRQILEETLGASLIQQLQYQWSWAIISRKGASVPVAERIQPNGLAVIERLVSFPLPEVNGSQAAAAGLP